MAGNCECGYEHSGSIKCREFLDYLQTQSASQEGLCSMECVSFVAVVIIVACCERTEAAPYFIDILIYIFSINECELSLSLCVTHNEIFIGNRICLTVRFSESVSSCFEFILSLSTAVIRIEGYLKMNVAGRSCRYIQILQ